MLDYALVVGSGAILGSACVDYYTTITAQATVYTKTTWLAVVCAFVVAFGLLASTLDTVLQKITLAAMTIVLCLYGIRLRKTLTGALYYTSVSAEGVVLVLFTWIAILDVRHNVMLLVVCCLVGYCVVKGAQYLQQPKKIIVEPVSAAFEDSM